MHANTKSDAKVKGDTENLIYTRNKQHRCYLD